MYKENVTTLLASFATLKALSDAKKYTNPYQILWEFISYIIGTQKLYVFSAVEMKNQLNQVFGFDIPEAVIKSSCKTQESIERNKNQYIVDSQKFLFDLSFAKAKSAAEKAEANVISALAAYVKEKTPEQKISDDILGQALVVFLSGDRQNGYAQLMDVIGEFVLKNENNVKIQEALAAIQEGSILYIGLNHNINETGSITKRLTLFLGTEVLFSLAGYNGEIHKQLADDFYAQVRNANMNGEKIRLRYFYETKQEIEGFFAMAELIAEGKMPPSPKVAMKAIVNHCRTASDVTVKRSDFYHLLQFSFGIYEDDREDYYSTENHVYNLESLDQEDGPEKEAWRFVSHINKLRKGKVFTNNIDAEYLLVTNTSSTLKVSESQTEKDKGERGQERVSDYAISLSKATNVLWYKLGNGFGQKDFPSSVNAVLKARIVLASTISHNIIEVFNEENEKYKRGEITREQLAARIVSLHRKPSLPEELEGDSIEEIMDFSSEFISRFEEEVKQNKHALEEKEHEIQVVRDESERKIKEREDTITRQDQELKKAEKENRALATLIAEYQKKEEIKERQRKIIKQVVRFSFSILWKLAIIAVITVVAFYCEKKFNSTLPLYICAAVDLVALSATGWCAVKKDFRKHFPREEQKQYQL